MTIFPHSAMTDEVYRVGIYTYGGLATAIGIGSVVVPPWDSRSWFGVCIAVLGLVAMWRWWKLRPELPGRAGRLQLRGAILALASGVLVALSVGLLFNTTEPGDPPTAFILTIVLGALGIACWGMRITVGIQTRRAARTEPNTSRRTAVSRRRG